MTNYSGIADGKPKIKGEHRYVNTVTIKLDCADLDKGLFEKAGYSSIAVGNVYAIAQLPANVKFLSAGIRVIKAEGGAATVTVTITNSSYSVLITASSTTDANSVGNEVVYVTQDYLLVDSLVCIASSAELDTAKLHIDIQYVVLDESIAAE